MQNLLSFGIKSKNVCHDKIKKIYYVLKKSKNRLCIEKYLKYITYWKNLEIYHILKNSRNILCIEKDLKNILCI